MSDQSTALRLASRLENDGFYSETVILAAAELRRLQAENVLLKSRLTTDERLYTLALEERDAARHVYQILKDQRNVLLDSLVSFTKSEFIKKKHPKRYAKAIVAIKAVEE